MKSMVVTLRDVRRLFHGFVLGLAALAALLTPATGWASPGCRAINQGALSGTATFAGTGNPTDTNFVEAGNLTPFLSDRATTLAFNAGDKINFTVAFGAGLYGYFRYNAPSANYYPGFQNPTPGSYSVTLPAGVTKAYLFSGRLDTSTNGTVAASVSCVPVAPSITGISPGTGNNGDPITITGTSLLETTGIKFGGVPASSFSIVSDTQILVQAPYGAGTVDVTVTNAGGTSATSAASRFTYTTSTPLWASETGLFSSTNGGGVIILDGAGFTGAVVKFDGITVTPTLQTENRLELVAPPHAAGAFDITITNAFGSADPPASIEWITPPSLSAAFSPASIPSGGTSRLTFTFNKNRTSYVANPLSFSTMLPAGMVIAPTPNAVLSGCASGTVSAVAGASIVGLSSARIANGTQFCTLAVDVVATGTGTLYLTPGDGSAPAMTIGGALIAGSAGSPATLTLPSPMTLTPDTLPGGTAGIAYNQSLTADGGTAPYHYAVTDGDLPPGLTLSDSGALTGTPDTPGQYEFTVTATDSASPTANQAARSYTLEVAPPAEGVSRTWVSGTGDDANPCSRTAPCLTFAGAFARTANGGEINCLTPGGFGTLTITHSVSILCDAVGPGVIAAGTDGIVINGPPDTVVVLSGLNLTGLGTGGVNGTNGILFRGGAALTVRNSTIRDFRDGYGIAFRPSSNAVLIVDRVTVSGNGSAAIPASGGILVLPSGNATASATILRSQVSGNRQTGVRFDTTGNQSARVTGLIDRTTISGSSNSGVFAKAIAGTGSIEIAVVNANLSQNGVGVYGNGSAVIRVGGTTISGNVTGISAINGTVVRSWGGNMLAGNGVDGSFTASPAP